MLQSFLQVVLDKHIVSIADKNLAASSERQTLLREQTRVGVRNIADLYRQEAQTSSDEAFLIQSQQKLRSDAILLLRKVRLDTTADYEYIEPELEPGPPRALPTEGTLVQTALEKRSDLKAAQSVSSAASWRVTEARAGFLPKLDLGASVFSNARWLTKNNANGVNTVPPGQTPLWSQLGNQTYYTVGLTLTWNIFDRFVTAQNVSQANVEADNARIDFEDRRLRVVGEIRQAYGDYRSAVQSLESAKKGLQAAQQAYETVEGRYKVGAASFIDLITAQSSLVQAQTAHIQAEIEFTLQGKLIGFYTGEIPLSADVALK